MISSSGEEAGGNLGTAVWFQLGICHDAAARRLAEAGILVVQDRCTLIEHRRLIGRPVR